MVGGGWGAKGPGPDRLGLKCYLASGGTRVVVVVGGGKWGNFMYLNHNLLLVTAKRMLEAFIRTNFPIRVFWQGWDRQNILQMTRLLVCKL